MISKINDADIEEIVKIESDLFGNSAWNKEQFLYEMNEISTTNSDGNDNIQKIDNDKNFLMKEEPNILLKERDNELDKIVKGVSNLHEMFKDMTILVNEQGTILDRIDYNIDIGYDNVSRGKKKLHEANDQMVLVVSDTGIGIPSADQARVFERFYRVDKGRSRALGGTGLGLAIVKHIVSYYDGKIQLQSQLDVGTQITISLPMKKVD